MSEVVAIVEGETEQTFVRDQLASHMGSRGVAIWAVLPGRDRRRGGIKKWEVAKRDIIYTLREGRYCTTMFDYYAMPTDWPGRAESARLPWNERAAHIEQAVQIAIRQAMGDEFDPRFFVPYVQLHEFEALTFSDTRKLGAMVASLQNRASDPLIAHFQAILDEAGAPEAINDSRETCPSRRIVAIEPAYKKRVHGPIVTIRIGLEKLRSECHHFATWLERLETIPCKAE